MAVLYVLRHSCAGLGQRGAPPGAGMLLVILKLPVKLCQPGGTGVPQGITQSEACLL